MANNNPPQVTNVIAYRRSFEYSAGVPNSQSWYSHTGEDSTTPAISADFSCSSRAENGPVASSLHPSPSPSTSRSEAGTAQYGPVRMSDRLGNPIAGMPWPNQTNPTMVPTRMPRVPKNSR